MPHDSDWQAGAHQTGEIEITEEMISAGVSVLWESGRFDPVGPPDRLLVREMLEAALALRADRV
jgi:hypothetical protein